MEDVISNILELCSARGYVLSRRSSWLHYDMRQQGGSSLTLRIAMAVQETY